MNAKTEAAVRKHGENLLAIFPHATERDPVRLCRKLRKLEREGAALGLRLCNGPEFDWDDTPDGIEAGIMLRVTALLGNESGTVPVFVNLDPRGYALKISSEWTFAYCQHTGNRLYSDWGGFGIIAPDLSER